MSDLGVALNKCYLLLLFLPKLGILDAQFFGGELGVFDAGALLALVVFQDAEGLAGEEQDDDDVDPCHEAYAHVAKAPNGVGLLETAKEHGADEHHAQHCDNHFLAAGMGGMVLAEKVYEVGLGIIVVGHHGGEGKEEQRDADDDAAPALTQQGAECRNGVVNTRQPKFGNARLNQVASRVWVYHVVAAGGQQHDGGGGADQQGVDIDRETLHQSLLHGMVDLGGSGHDGGGALSGLVAVDASFHTPGNGGTYDAAQHLVGAESTSDHIAEGCGHGLIVDHKHHNGQDDIGNGHEGCDQLGYLRNALHAADDYQCDEGGHGHTHDPGG